MTKIYSIGLDMNSYSEEDYDGVLRGDLDSIPSSSSEQSQQRVSKAPKVMPESIDYDTDNPERLKNVNIAFHFGGNIDIFSKKLIDVITNVGSVDWTLVPAKYFDISRKHEVCKDQFNAVFFENFNDYFDYELSEYKLLYPNHKNERRQKEVVSVKKWVLKKPDNGFPPYFRLLADHGLLLINEKTHDAIVSANITGVKMSLIGDF